MVVSFRVEGLTLNPKPQGSGLGVCNFSNLSEGYLWGQGMGFRVSGSKFRAWGLGSLGGLGSGVQTLNPKTP